MIRQSQRLAVVVTEREFRLRLRSERINFTPRLTDDQDLRNALSGRVSLAAHRVAGVAALTAASWPAFQSEFAALVGMAALCVMVVMSIVAAVSRGKRLSRHREWHAVIRRRSERLVSADEPPSGS